MSAGGGPPNTDAIRLPYHVPLLPGEALSSWIWRLAARFDISALHLLQGAFGLSRIDKESARYGTWWRTPTATMWPERWWRIIRAPS